MNPTQPCSNSVDNSPLLPRTMPAALLGLCFLGAAATIAQSATVATFNGGLSFGSPDPASLAPSGTRYQGLVTGQTGGAPQITVTTTNDTTLTEAAGDWTGAGSIAPIGSYTFRDQHSSGAAAHPRPAAFDLFGTVATTLPGTTGPTPTTEFSITGLTFAVRDRVGYVSNDDITLNIVDAAGVVVATGNLDPTGVAGSLNASGGSLDGGGIYSGPINFTPVAGHVAADSYSVQVDFEPAGWGGPDEGFWLDLTGAELSVDFLVGDVVPEPSRAVLVLCGLGAILMRRRRIA